MKVKVMVKGCTISYVNKFFTKIEVQSRVSVCGRLGGLVVGVQLGRCIKILIFFYISGDCHSALSTKTLI